MPFKAQVRSPGTDNGIEATTGPQQEYSAGLVSSV
jgi:hypothetical protein